jgi:hypothetical protein
MPLLILSYFHWVWSQFCLVGVTSLILSDSTYPNSSFAFRVRTNTYWPWGSIEQSIVYSSDIYNRFSFHIEEDCIALPYPAQNCNSMQHLVPWINYSTDRNVPLSSTHENTFTLALFAQGEVRPQIIFVKISNSMIFGGKHRLCCHLFGTASN